MVDNRPPAKGVHRGSARTKTGGRIRSVDANGVTMAAIKALNARLETIERENRRLHKKVERLQRSCR